MLWDVMDYSNLSMPYVHEEIAEEEKKYVPPYMLINNPRYYHPSCRLAVQGILRPPIFHLIQ
jgi:hypothetical protein